MINIVPMNHSHVPAIAALEQQLFSAPWDEASVRGELFNELSLWLVAEENGSVLGYIGSQTVLGESDMLNLAVHPDHRRKGIGRLLTESLCDALLKMGSHCITLEVRVSNEPAKQLYASLGFESVGRRPRYYSRPVEDADILRKELVP